MAQYHEVHVITRANNKEIIESSSEYKKNTQLHFHYYDLPKYLMFWKNKRRGYQLYYYLWQVFIYFKFNKFINSNDFDIVHHLTFGSALMPSLLMLTHPQTIWGPIGTDDTYTPILRSLPLRLKIKEYCRTTLRAYFLYIDPLRWLTVLKAQLILCHSSSYSSYKFPAFLQHKVRKHIQTGLNTDEPEYSDIVRPKPFSSPIRLIIASELVAWKGVLIASEVFSKIAYKRDDVELIILGEGPEKKTHDAYIRRI